MKASFLVSFLSQTTGDCGTENHGSDLFGQPGRLLQTTPGVTLGRKAMGPVYSDSQAA